MCLGAAFAVSPVSPVGSFAGFASLSRASRGFVISFPFASPGMAPQRSTKRVRVPERSCANPRLQNEVCHFCKMQKSSVGNDEMLKGTKIMVHYYCLLFSSGLKQRGNTSGPLNGFLLADVMAELRRGAKLKCCYCNKFKATVACCLKMCEKKFHVGCGIANDCLLQFYGDFRAYCPDHRPNQHMTPKETGPASCLICACELVPQPSPRVLLTPCCKNSFHKACLQAQAMSAGSHLFKCSVCNNKEAFQKEMLDYGISIPERDASWERQQGAYQELLYRYQRCDAVRCRCPMGREISLDGCSDWEVIPCSTCGSQGIHKACGNLSRAPVQNANLWICVQCRKVLSQRLPTGLPNGPLKSKGAAASTSTPSESPLTEMDGTELPSPERAVEAASPGPKVLYPSIRAADAVADSSPQSEFGEDSDVEFVKVVPHQKPAPTPIVISDESSSEDSCEYTDCQRKKNCFEFHFEPGSVHLEKVDGFVVISLDPHRGSAETSHT
ncbi:G2/M phase-specific E3 ubiquitin-protein ligase isoform X1 [Ixodes scapularis]|uniref:G2/M phase-specific E3 ubiquitin-protein ligase isoform X1 n=2 Tax=Ixodes scapularis TaxID=6945 RepID=UPI001AD69417|nr:G2/M phase-specific E3 ubiquitin-protein ligase isoform X1 [Ixodes scapularis]